MGFSIFGVHFAQSVDRRKTAKWFLERPPLPCWLQDLLLLSLDEPSVTKLSFLAHPGTRSPALKWLSMALSSLLVFQHIQSGVFECAKIQGRRRRIENIKP